MDNDMAIQLSIPELTICGDRPPDGASIVKSSDEPLSLYCPIAKTARTKDGLMVYGWASVADYLDDQDEIVDAEALREAVAEWSEWRNIRLMHQPDPIGVAPLVEIKPHPDTGRDALWLGATIVDGR